MSLLMGDTEIEQDIHMSSRLVALLEELETVGLLIKENPNDDELWCKRLMLAEELGAHAEGAQLEFTKEILLEDPSNKYAWSQRKSVLESSCGWEEEEELELCDQFIHANKFKGSDECAWDQRYFVVGKSVTQVQLEAEALYARKVILATPENKHAWAYLRCMYRRFKVVGEGSEFKDELLDDIHDCFWCKR
ncbi:protein farnesyltransferase/ geranylgeranyltransferase type-1 subunit alpha [Phtheirospermum japonicum]|uniref:Protein farnesyltransferase/geranylgeranyltransferase type-1 subunit alpha n=1 Tax=Phtheirospermum japonicum TaxID=374723 RepID=A0A830CSY2_9LAMI|nr:protein farnesyltransferase/ geranylgeranyltransferase type-1 subunit alpha [Phtheirospermum japonicum]